MQCLNDLDALLLDVPNIRKRDARFAADFEIKFAHTRAAIADTLRALTAERDEAQVLHRLVCAKFDEAVRERDAIAAQLQQAQRELAAVPVDAMRKMRFDVEVELHGYSNAELDEWLDAEQEAANAAAELRAPTYNGGCW